jgi:SOS response regulatory protein OraA/RecX
MIASAVEKVFSEHDELAMAQKLFAKHFKHLKAPGKSRRDARTRNKVKNYLSGNGFSFEIIRRVIADSDAETE